MICAELHNAAPQTACVRLRARAGHTLIELLVSMMLSTVVLGIVARDFGYYVHTRDGMELVAETQQAASAALTFITQELRQAGACLPELGKFIALGGEDNGDRDTLVLRIGIADTVTLQCARTILTAQARRNRSDMQVESSSRFAAGQWLYLISGTGHGNFFRIASINNNTITINGVFDVNYAANSGVYAVEEREYRVADFNGVSTLMVSIDGRPAEPLARGITSFDVQYKMAPCPPCESVDVPSSDTQWRVVREVDIALTARSSRPGKDGRYIEIGNRGSVKPRNLL